MYKLKRSIGDLLGRGGKNSGGVKMHRVWRCADLQGESPRRGGGETSWEEGVRGEDLSRGMTPFSTPSSRNQYQYEYGRNLCPRKTAHAQTKYQDNSTSGRGARASYQTMLPEISARRSLLWVKVQIPVVADRHWDKSAPRPYVTDPFHPLNPIHT